jgi:hypothetical protein
MRIAELFKQRSPHSDARRKVRAAIDAGKVAEDANAFAALELIFDCPERDELVLALVELGGKTYLSGTVRELLWGLDRLDRNYLSEHKK